MSQNSPIGVFDSGFGGLEILKEMVGVLPQYNFIYLGDSARAPYGSRSQELVYNFTREAVDFLFKQGCHLIILACNTASSEALRKIQRDYLQKHHPEKRVLGVIIPAAEAAVEVTENKRIGVIATEGTVFSGAFTRELKKLEPLIKVFQQACPLLVPLVEAGEYNLRIAEMALRNYLRPLLCHNIDTLILGCTHYGLLLGQISQIVGPNIKLISEGKVIAQKLKDYLQRHSEIESKLSKNYKIKFLTTDLTDKFQILGSQFFGEPIRPERVALDRNF